VANWDSVIVNSIGLYKEKAITGINAEFLDNSSELFQAHPNPTENFTFIDLRKGYHEISIKLTTPAGLVLYEKKYSYAEKLNIDLPNNSGLYILDISTREGKNARIKVLKK
jgi:hypothetical protein